MPNFGARLQCFKDIVKFLGRVILLLKIRLLEFASLAAKT